MLKQNFQKIMMLCLAFIGININASAIDLQSTLDFSTNQLGLEKSTTFPGIKSAAWTRSNKDVSRCNFDGLEFNGITLNGTWDCTIPTDQGYAVEGYKNNGSWNDPCLRYQTSTSVGSTDPFMFINTYNTVTFTAPDGYELKSITFHYFWNNNSSYYYNGFYNGRNAIWSDGGEYSLSNNDSEGTFTATTSLKTVSVIGYSASHPMWITSIDFTLVEVGGSSPVVTKYNVNKDNSMVGGTVVASPTKAAEGDEVTLNPQPESGYTYANGSLTVTNEATSTAISVSADNKFTMPASDVTVSASFTPIEYTITVKPDPKGSHGTGSADKSTAHKGETVTLTATPDDGYELVGWDAEFDAVDVNLSTNTFIMPAMDVTITPVFAKPKHTVKTTKTGNGTITLSPSSSVSEGAAFRVIATPATGYELESIVVTDDVTGDVIEVDAEIANTYEMPAHNVTVTVVFVKSTYTITVDGSIANGTVTASRTSAQYGDQVTLTATPATGYEFKSWNVTNGSGATVSVNALNQFTMPADNITVSATFAKQTSSDGWTFDDATFTPALNTPVASISTIKIDYNGIEPIGTSGADNGMASFTGPVGTISNGTTTYVAYAGNDMFDAGYLTIDVADNTYNRCTITEAGTWTLHFNAGILNSFAGRIPNAAMNYTFIIAGSAPENVEIPISAAGYATYVTEYPLDFTGNAIEAFAVSDVDAYAGKMTLTKLTKVPAGEAIIVKGETGNVPVIESAAKIDNQLDHHDTDIVVSEWTGTSFYGLAEGSKGVGFYPVTGTIAAGKGFISVTEMAGAAKSLTFDFGDATGINNVKAAQSNVMFNLAGQRIKNANGLVIKNGKKFVK